MVQEKINELIKNNIKHLDSKNEQTSYKIKYITKYVDNWLRILSHAEFCSNLNFIDCMCNAGIYSDGDFCTAFKVLELFKNYAYQFPNKRYSLYINDVSADRLNIFTALVEIVFGDKLPNNISLYKNNNDVNDYLKILTNNDNLFTYPNATLLYVDPYDFGTVHIPTLQSFIKKYYCEVLFNVFTSDFVRNHMDARILKALGDENVIIRTKEELVDYIITKLKVHKMKYSFAYEFRISTNVELYQIMFLTPSDKGLDELKDALWDTFKGFAFHRNSNKKRNGQISLFTDKDDIQENLRNYLNEAKEYLINNYPNATLSYKELCDFILPRSMLKSSHIIKDLLRPAIANGEIIKLNRVNRKLNYKEDFYLIKEKLK